MHNRKCDLLKKAYSQRFQKGVFSSTALKNHSELPQKAYSEQFLKEKKFLV